MRIPPKWGTDSGEVGQRRSGATLATAWSEWYGTTCSAPMGVRSSNCNHRRCPVAPGPRCISAFHQRSSTWRGFGHR